jgi:hypothetical protein
MSMFSGATSFPISGAIKILFWLAVVGAVTMLGCGVALVWWLVTHVRFA